MKEKITGLFDKVLKANKNDDIKNILLTDSSEEFRDKALEALREWATNG